MNPTLRSCLNQRLTQITGWPQVIEGCLYLIRCKSKIGECDYLRTLVAVVQQRSAVVPFVTEFMAAVTQTRVVHADAIGAGFDYFDGLWCVAHAPEYKGKKLVVKDIFT